MRAIKRLLRLTMKLYSVYRAWSFIRDSIDAL